MLLSGSDTSLIKPSSELFPHLLAEDRRAQPARDAKGPYEILLALTSLRCSCHCGWENIVAQPFYHFTNLPICLMLWGWYVPITDPCFHNRIMCLCAWCSWDFHSFLFIQAFMLHRDLSASTTSKWTWNIDEGKLKQRAGHCRVALPHKSWARNHLGGSEACLL